ncbi:PAS domain S-box protein [Methanoculleus chikugoensis]|uniref:PAS domain-containing protein n=1 Tax=Methanoculleus chikugoensis TaxID=118126 RepID=UPI0006D16E61|nr:PAS domain-containing protein [Methanoculleus chikugoensis]
MAAIMAENETLRRENAALQSVKDALRESEERYRRLFEADLTGGDVVAAPDGRILSCNPAFARIFGFASRGGEAPGTDIRDLFEDPGDLDRVVASLRKEGKIENVGRTRRRRDGTRIHIVENVVGRFGPPGGELLEIQGYIYDDSERKRAEEALRESMEWYRQALDNPLIGYAHCEVVVDAAGKPVDYIYLEVNRAFELFTGLRWEEVANRRVTEVLHLDEAAGIIAIYGNVALTGESTAFQYLCRLLRNGSRSPRFHINGGDDLQPSSPTSPSANGWRRLSGRARSVTGGSSKTISPGTSSPSRMAG